MKTKLYTYVRLWMYCILLLVSFSCFGQQVARGLTASNGTFIGFWEYKPTDYDANPNTKYPLIIFLHGIGERGDGTTQLSYVLANAIPKYISQGCPMKFYVNGQWQTFLVLSPQLSTMYGSWQNFYVDEMLNYAKQNLRVDTNRIYLTGLSLGGGGTWKYATYSLDNASKFAAIMTCCGTCEWSNVCNLAQANTPVWSFHAQDDGVVGVGCTTGAISMLNSCNPPFTPLMTIWPTGNHYIWDRAYDTTHNVQNPNVYEWFLMHARSNVPLPPNIPPIANAGPDQSITLPTNAVTLNGTGSVDPDGTIVSYSWAKISGPAQFTISNFDQSITSVTNLITGTYLFELTVTDNRSGTSKDTVAITVNPPPPGTNLPPVAVAGSDATINTTTYTLNSWGSYDPDGSIVAYQWRKIAGPTQYSISGAVYATANLSNLVNGTYTFELQVTDNLGAIAKDSVNINVALPNTPPVANAGPDQTITLPTNSVTLNGSSSSDADGTITSYAWSKISGPSSYTIVNASGASTAVNSLVQGTYLFRLVVTDNNGGTDDDTVAITVNAAAPPPNLPPVANAGADQTITLPTNSVTLNGTASSDPDGAIASYAWTKISGPASGTIVSPTGGTTVVNSLVQGTYSFKLVVTDYYGATGADTIVVVVNAAPPPANIPPVANAGTDQSITLPTNSVTLNGSGSSDADGTISTYAWSKISGPASYSIVNSNSASTLVNGLVQGTYSFRLVVTDNNGATDDDTVVVAVNPAPPPANVPPIANAGADQSITLPTSVVTLNGSGSSDPDGTISSYAWTKINGPSSYSITSPNSVSTTVTGLVQGTYQFRLVVTDNSGASDDDTVSVTVYPVPPPANLAPHADAGADQTITLPNNSVTLNGSGSSDPDGSIASYTWTKIGGPSTYSLGNPNSVSTSLSGLVQGTYQLQLMVTDNNGASAFDTVLITVNAAPPPPNIPPVANAGADQSITLPTNSVTLNGTASSDADGTITSYAWTKISGPSSYNIANASGSTTAVTNLVQGTYSFRLVVTDNSGGTDDDTVVVVVNAAPPAANIPPVANAGVDQVITLPTNSITLNGTASSDADGTITSYAWSKIGGPSSYVIANANAATTAVNGLVQGTYLFRLVVTDNSGATGDDTVSITVNAAPPPPNVPPVANAGGDQTITLPTNAVTLSGTASSDADGTIVSYAWAKISGPALFSIGNPYAATTAVTNLIQGTYMFQLIVTDNSGATDADTVIVTVNPAPLPPNIPPVANAGNDTTITLPNSGLQLSGAASSDPDGGIVSYSWSTVSGPSGLTIVNATSVTPTIVGLVPGNYVIRLTVTDNAGATGTDDVTIHVLAQQNLAPIARAGNDTTIAVPSTTAYLNGAGSYDPDGRIAGYQWRQIAGAAGPIISNNLVALTTVNSMQPGVYAFELTVTDDLGLTGKDTVLISVVDNFRYDEELTIYPNPTRGAAHVRCITDSTGDMLIRILDMNGIVVQVIEAVKAQSYFEKDIQVQTLKSGTYYLEAIIGDKKRMIKKFVKQ
jgi:poly(3-hydroxybutyrate) depolymerase